MTRDTLAESTSGSSTEDCPVKFSAETDRPFTPGETISTRLYCNSPGLQLKLETSNGQLKIKSYHRHGLPKCPICRTYRSKYYCQDCVKSGDFVHSGTRFYERFADKNLRHFALQRDIGEAREQIHQRTAANAHKKKVKEEMRQLQTKLKHIKHYIKVTKEKKLQKEINLQTLTTSNNKRVDRLPEYQAKVDKIRMCVRKFNKELENIQAMYYTQRKDLHEVRINLVESLSDIFPVEEVFPVQADQSDMMLDCLAEAMRTSYINGRWVSVEQSGEMQYRVVAPLLAGSGDYSPLYALIDSREGSAGAGVEPLPAFNISAGLTLVTQLVKLLAHLTSVPLPIKLSYADFGVIESSEYRFAKKVAKLNLSIVGLCLSHGVDPSTIRPCQTVYNVILLVKHLLNSRSEMDSHLSRSLISSDIEQSYCEFAYFAPVASEWNASDWERMIHHESEDLRSKLPPTEEESEAENEEEALQEWESVAADDLSDTLSSSPPDRNLERRPSSSMGIVSSVSSLIWGITSPKSPRK